jgi:hypothetical protein
MCQPSSISALFFLFFSLNKTSKSKKRRRRKPTDQCCLSFFLLVIIFPIFFINTHTLIIPMVLKFLSSHDQAMTKMVSGLISLGLCKLEDDLQKKS